ADARGACPARAPGDRRRRVRRHGRADHAGRHNRADRRRVRPRARRRARGSRHRAGRDGAERSVPLSRARKRSRRRVQRGDGHRAARGVGRNARRARRRTTRTGAATRRTRGNRRRALRGATRRRRTGAAATYGAAARARQRPRELRAGPCVACARTAARRTIVAATADAASRRSGREHRRRRPRDRRGMRAAHRRGTYGAALARAEGRAHSRRERAERQRTHEDASRGQPGPKPRRARRLNATLRAHRAAPIALSFGAGLVQAASFRPFEAWWLQLAALATLVWLVLRSPERARWLGFAFGFGCFVAGVSWLHVSMHRYGGMPAVLAALALLLFAAYLAAFPAIACEALGRLDATLRRRPTTRLARAAALALLFSAAWALTEVLRGWLFTGFPWLAIGYAHVDGPLAGFAPLLGVYGVCLLAACVAFGIALAVGGLPTLQPAEVVQGGEAVPAAGTAPVLDPTGGIAPASASAARAFGVLAAALPLVAGLALS